MKYVTIIDIAKELGISKSTVSRALSGDTSNVKPETLELIQKTAQRMNYHRNELAVNLRKQNTHTIGIVIPEVVTSFFMNFIEHAQRALRMQGYRTLVAISNEDPEQERDNLMMLEQCRVDGIMICVCNHDYNAQLYKDIIKHGIPMVFFDRTVEGIDAPQVMTDDYIMSFFMVEALVRRGYRKIVHLAGPDHVRNCFARQRGYRDALEKFKIEYDKRYVVYGGLNDEEGAAAMRRIIDSGINFDAVFAFTEMSALGAKTALQKKGYRIPDDVALCCMSGTVFSTLVHPTLTAVEQPVKTMAETACRLLMTRINDTSTPKEDVVLRGEMIFRESFPNLTKE